MMVQVLPTNKKVHSSLRSSFSENLYDEKPHAHAHALA